MAANTAPVSVASKNLYELLGNDPDQDPDLRVEPTPVNPVDKTQARTGKRNGPSEAPVTDAAINGDRGGRGRGRGRGARGRGRGGNEQAFLDNDAGHARNRDRPTPEGRGDRAPRGSGEGRGEGRGERRGGRGRGRGQGVRDDRHSRTVHSGPNDQAKQAAHGWGGETGIAELQDEQAGEAIAFEENKGADNWNQDEPVNADGEKLDGAVADDAAPEPEDKTKSYADYIAEQAQKKLQLGGSLTARKANEGTSVNHPEGKTVEREETDYFAGAGAKARRERERKEKNVVVLDHDIGARDQPAPRGGRGGRGRGRGDGPFRGEGRGRGGFRGRGEGRGEGRPEGRGEFRGRVGRGGPAPNLSSAQDFPGLGK